MAATIVPSICRICGLDKGGEDKQACNFCWSTLSLEQKRAWYKAAWAGQLSRFVEGLTRSATR